MAFQGREGRADKQRTKQAFLGVHNGTAWMGLGESNDVKRQ